ncbi:Isoquinoline 1-oxidoreductase alpha subunit [Indibacter alkaliphilus LW1]|jgi:nicotinate dehydrogenase subunit A|uniref:Isoquinoline 1-oxidoreductase alpha subunit n=1 Tax=Indibacter alkaliphilus (strain CCUG 57479 / KCTC 22604 / LW1) TaxID=1189612 RepID=S2DK26_INDAL|nr:(2Fe-2S)-binding protein [Indibacter alkaliphilus]EOZ92356.1 Isoquinoline 1-oxidoreductase alpha subunit [Indibacter alkaliphilus LW1]
MAIKLKVNGVSLTIEADPEEPLLYILREEFGFNGAKFGCGLQQCGTCMVLADGEALATCVQPCQNFEGMEIITIEGLSEGDKSHPLQETFYSEQAAQCGYCVNGMLIAALALLRKNPKPNDEEIRLSLDKVICRCGTHSRFISAVKKAADQNSRF